MSEPLKTYAGTLRPRFTYVETVTDTFGINHHMLKVQWVADNGTVIWTETAKTQDGHAFVSQITCAGEFATSSAFTVDEDGKRHFSMKCDPGVLGAPFGVVQMFGPQGN